MFHYREPEWVSVAPLLSHYDRRARRLRAEFLRNGFRAVARLFR